MPFILDYKDIAAFSPRELYILYHFRLTAISKVFCLRRKEVVNLGQAGFGDFVPDGRVRRLKGKCDENKDVYCLI